MKMKPTNLCITSHDEHLAHVNDTVEFRGEHIGYPWDRRRGKVIRVSADFAEVQPHDAADPILLGPREYRVID